MSQITSPHTRTIDNNQASTLIPLQAHQSNRNIQRGVLTQTQQRQIHQPQPNQILLQQLLTPNNPPGQQPQLQINSHYSSMLNQFVNGQIVIHPQKLYFGAFDDLDDNNTLTILENAYR
ncbi:7235_t:CDS:1 [Ambispora gerdemannii]|uniref:7235_t:CDS:1 n=1 Tax=Ambispora gerdemannii TaxID=144530 RepID=A0A9N8ZWM0_9GLOM|nr:7235_t:CDS:1 [Ambispora gerdemannii]